MTVYLLHALEPYIPAGCEDRPGCWMMHYLGSADDLAERLADHRRGRGSNVCLVWKQAGIGFVLARTWEGGRRREHDIKRTVSGKYKPLPRLCPECHPMPRIDRWAGGQLPRPCERIKTRLIDPVTINDPWALPPAAEFRTVA